MALPPPYELVDNGESLLDLTDLVFIDPVTTGYSRAVAGDGRRRSSTASRTTPSRWASSSACGPPASAAGRAPKFLAGESYGTTRAARPVERPPEPPRDVPQRHHPHLLDPQLPDRPLRRRQRPAVPAVPADLHGHRLVPQAAAAGPAGDDRGPGGRRRRGASPSASTPWRWRRATTCRRSSGRPSPRRSSRYTGLSTEFVQRANLRPEIQAFCKELLRDQRTTVGRLDSRFKGLDRDAARRRPSTTPATPPSRGRTRPCSTTT